MSSGHLFYNRNLEVATMHEKELIFKPIFSKGFGMKVYSSFGINTDHFGTFSGEIERKRDPIATARLKCIQAHEKSKCDLILASEGSFGPHPTHFFLPMNEELLLLKDFKNNLEIVEFSRTSITNFGSLSSANVVNLNQFLEQVKFPSHRLVIRKSVEDHSSIIKGLSSKKKLKELISDYTKEQLSWIIETDMRSMYNPTRRKHIRKLAWKLLQKMKSECPICRFPGYVVKEYIRGLPCGLCQNPTSGIAQEILSCDHCHLKEVKKIRNAKLFEDPMYCDFCNP